MILRIIDSFFTEKESARLEAIQEKALHAFIIDSEEEIDLDALYEERTRIEDRAVNRYIESLALDENKVYEDAQEIISAAVKEDFLDTIDLGTETHRAFLDGLRKDYAAGKIDSKAFYDRCQSVIFKTHDNPDAAAQFLTDLVRVQYGVLVAMEKPFAPINKAIDQKMVEWYPEIATYEEIEPEKVNDEEPPPATLTPSKTHCPIPYSRFTAALRNPNIKKAQNTLNGTLIIDDEEVRLFVEDFAAKRGTLGISTDKLLSYSLKEFAENNHMDGTLLITPNPYISFSLKDFARACGYDVDELPMATPEERKKEKRRAKRQLDKAREVVLKDIDILWKWSVEGKQKFYNRKKKKHETKSYSRMRVFEYVKLERGGIIKMTFSSTMATILMELNQIGQYHKRAFAIDGNHQNAYKIFLKLDGHYNILNNIEQGTNDRIKISNLLAATSLPTFEEVQKKDRGHWAERIKEPLEKSLDYLKHEGFLTDWEYTHEKGRPLTDAEASDLTDYTGFCNLYLKFEPHDKVDHQEALEKRKANRAEAGQKKKSRKKKS